MFKNLSLLSALWLVISGGLNQATANENSDAIEGKVTRVVCSTSTPRVEGFVLVQVSPRKRAGKGSHNVRTGSYRDGGIVFQGTYDVDSSRLNASVVQVDEDGDEIQFLASVEAVVASGQHLRITFMKPAGSAKESLEKVELVCNVVHFAP